MLKVVVNRIKQGCRTLKYPRGNAPDLASRYRGAPIVAGVASSVPGRVDLGKTPFAPDEGFAYSNDFRLAVSKRGDLAVDGKAIELAHAFDAEMMRVFGRSLKLRQVSAGGCNACELDLNVLNTPVFALARFGIQFTASPRHADGIVVTGPVTRNMREALLKTYEAIPAPKIVIALGTCAISGGIFSGGPEVSGGLESILPVDLFIPGCPPHPLTTLDGLLRLMGRIKGR